MGDDLEARRCYAIGASQQRCRRLGHDHGPGRRIDELGEDPPLRGGGVPEHRMERRYGRHPQGADEVEHVGAVIAAPDAVLMLDGDDVHARGVERSRNGSVVGLLIAPDAVANLRRVRARLTNRVEGDDLALPHRRGEIMGEGRDPAAVRCISRNEDGSDHRWLHVLACRLQFGARWPLDDPALSLIDMPNAR